MKIAVFKADGSVQEIAAVRRTSFDVDERGALMVCYADGEVLAIFAPGTWLSAHRVEDVKTED